MKLIKKLLAMALAGVMLLTILTGCSGGKTGDRLVEEYIASYYHSSPVYKDKPITNDVPEIKTVADMFKAAWLNENGEWTLSPRKPDDPEYKALQKVFSKYSSGHTVLLCAFEVDSKQSELNQAMRVMIATLSNGLPIHTDHKSDLTAIQYATRLVTREGKSYRIAVVIYDHTAG